MKKIFTLLFGLALCAGAFAQYSGKHNSGNRGNSYSQSQYQGATGQGYGGNNGNYGYDNNKNGYSHEQRGYQKNGNDRSYGEREYSDRRYYDRDNFDRDNFDRDHRSGWGHEYRRHRHFRMW